MKFEEKLAKDYFDSLKFKSIEYEPIGNTPPDFLLNNYIAAEVRRLNKFNKGIPLEKVEYNVIPKITNLINRYCDNNYFEKTTIVSIVYQRPLNVSKNIIIDIQRTLSAQSKSPQYNTDFIIANNLILNFYPNSEKWENQFEVGGWVDMDRGGQVSSDICNSLKIIIKEKEAKIQNFFHLYSVWWLVLIDFIGYGSSTKIISEINGCIEESKFFNKVIIISPLNFKVNSTHNIHPKLDSKK